MGLVYKQLFREMLKEKIFLSLLLLLTMLTSLSFFFVMFSVDRNLAELGTMTILTENQKLYRNALNSNTALAYRFFASLLSLSAFVFVMFFYRFFRTEKRQIGCIRALGFREGLIQPFFVIVTATLSFLGAVLGLCGGYYLADILIYANSRTYGVTGVMKGIGINSLIIGITVPLAVFSATAFLCYGFVRNKEAGLLLAGDSGQIHIPAALRVADRISRLVPADRRFSLRIALRKPLSVLLLFTAVMAFNVCILLGRSLNLSSAKVLAMQTTGHNYEYETRYYELQTVAVPGHTMVYIDSPATFLLGDGAVERTVAGLSYTNSLYELKNRDSELLAAPNRGMIYINPEFSEVYGVEIGDSLAVDIIGGMYLFTVQDIVSNAETGKLYLNGNQLTEILGAAPGAYNGVFSMEEIPGDEITDKAERTADLERNAVSNQISGALNQAAGVLVGAILIFLALYLNFQDNTHDILILHMIGYRAGDIRKMLVDVYLPVLWTAFVATLVPSIFLAEEIQKTLSISTNDYMPFGVNGPVVLAAFLMACIIYRVVQITFTLGIRRMTANQNQGRQS